MKSLTCLLPVVVILLGCGKDPNVAAPIAAAAAVPPIKVTPIKPVRKTLVRMVEQPGQVEAFEEAPLFAKVTGYVQKLHVDLGDKVTGPKYDSVGKQTAPGQVLCELAIPELNEDPAGRSNRERARCGSRSTSTTPRGRCGRECFWPPT